MIGPLPPCAHLNDKLAGLLPTREQTLFLRACLHDGRQLHDAWSRWEHDTRADAPRYESLAPIAQFLPLLLWNLKRHGITAADDGLELGLRAAWLSEDVRYRTYRRLCTSAFEALSSAGIPFVVLKGAALMDLVYPIPLLRHVEDIDVLLHDADIERATVVLTQLGWRPMQRPVLPNPKHPPPLVHQSGLSIELHQRLLIPYYALPYGALWSRSRTATVMDVETRVLAAADALLHVCAHAMSAGGRRILRWVPDAWFVLERHADLDWEIFLATASQARACLPLYVALAYLANEFDAPVPPKVLDELRTAAARTGYVGRCAARLGASAWVNGSVGEIWAGPGSRTARLAHVWRRVFPPPVEFALHYDLQPWALPLCYVLRAARYTRCVRRAAALS